MMRPFTTKSNVTLLLAALCCLCTVAEGAVDCANPRKSVGTMSEAVFHGVEEATKLITEKKYSEAIDKLKQMVKADSDYEKAIVYYNLGFAYSSKDDYAGAADSFAKALALNAMPQQQHDQLQYNLGQLYLAAGKPDEGIKTLQTYIAESCAPVPADAHIYLANALAERKRYSEALPQIELAFTKAKAPKESWVQLKLAIHYELKDMPACAETLVQLIGIAPVKAEYWKQLSGIFLELKKDTQAVAVLALAERQGYIDKPNEQRNLYSIYMMLELPYKAGMMMEKALANGKVPENEENLEAVANAWINARESTKAEAALQKLAAIADNGEYYFRLGAIYGDDERWKESKQVLEKALKKGGLKHAGECWMRLAVAQFNLQDSTGAQASLEKSINYDETRKPAGEWLRHLRSRQVVTDQPAEPAQSPTPS